jgi:hypothetical protein
MWVVAGVGAAMALSGTQRLHKFLKTHPIVEVEWYAACVRGRLRRDVDRLLFAGDWRIQSHAARRKQQQPFVCIRLTVDRTHSDVIGCGRG